MTQTHSPRLRRRIVRRLVKLLAILVIALAAIAGSLRLLLPWLVSDPRQVAAFLSARLKVPVTLESSEARVLGTGPLLHLRGLRIGDEQPLILDEADLELDFTAFVLPWRPVIRDLRLNGLEIQIDRGPNGIRVRGLPLPSKPISLSVWMARIGQLSIRESTLRFVDTVSSSQFTIEHFHARAMRQGETLRFAARLGPQLRLVGSHVPDADWPWHLWLGGDPVFSDPQLRIAGLWPVSGQAQLQLRLQLDSALRARFESSLELLDLVYEAQAVTLAEQGEQIAARHQVPRLSLRTEGSFDPLKGLEIPFFELGSNEPQPARGQLSWPRHGEARLALAGLQLAPFADLLAALDVLPPEQGGVLYLASPRALLDRLELNWHGADWVLRSRVSELSFSGWNPRIPSVSGLAVELSADRRGARFSLQAPAGQIRSALALRAPVDFAFSAEGAAWPDSDRLRFELDQFSVQTGAADVAGSLQLAVGAGRPAHLDLQARVLAGDVHTAKTLVIVNKMPPKAVAWVDRALVEGQVRSGAAVYRGELGKPAWPFTEQQGRFHAWADFADGQLDYHPEWPRAEQVNADLEFINDGIHIPRMEGRVLGARISAHADIKVLKEPVFDAHFEGQADASEWLAFLRASPLGNRHGSQLLGMEAKGPVAARAALKLPLKRSLGEPELTGSAELEGVDFTDRKWLLDFRQVHGQARFDRSGFSTGALQLQTAVGSRGELRLAVGREVGSANVVEAALSGQFTAQDLFAEHEVLSPILARIEGRSDWQLEFVVPREGSSRLRMFSPLRGTRIDMPPPLGKSAASQSTLALEVDLPFNTGEPLKLSIGDSLRLQARLPSPGQDLTGVLRLGPGSIVGAPPARGLALEGELPEAQPQAWIGLVNSLVAGGEGEAGSFAGADLVLTGEGAGQTPGRLQIQLEDEGWRVQLQSRLATGTLLWQLKHGQESISADLAHLHLPRPATGSEGSPLPSIDPGQIPSLHLRAADFRLGDAQLGSLRLETFPEAQGLRVELMESDSAQLQLRGKGVWQGLGLAQNSSFELQFSANDLGKMLSTLGFAGYVSGGQTLTTLSARWPGAPSDFGLERMDGTLDVWIGAGRFLEVEPGAGRLFGLLSLSELPRRLALDFRDFFQSGMAFDEIKGRFTLNEGNAWTEDLAIKAPAANVLIIGRTGIAARDYDQQVVVRPKVGSVLPFVGALAGGPGGAAAGLLAQGVLRGERGAFLREYRIGGTWEKPQITKQELGRPDDG